MFQTRALWSPRQPGLSWLAIVRLGLVQAALGSIVVLTTSTLNRVMVVELSLAAVIPGILVGLHYAVQLGRPLWGHASDNGGSRTRWILGGLALLAIAGTAAAATTLLFEQNFWLGMIAALIAFTFIGFGIGASGTSLLALLASRTAPGRRPAAATLVWMMMIAGIVVTAIVSSVFLDPYSHLRLVTITAISGTIAFAVAALGVWGIERRSAAIRDPDDAAAPSATFGEALREIWHDPAARIFTLFVFVSMLAYQTQDLILEPFAGLLFGHTPGESTALGGMHHAGVFLGMAFVGIIGSVFATRRPGLLKLFTVTGCLGSGLALGFLAVAASAAPAWPLEANVFALGFANGVFAVAAIGTMMTLAGQGTKSREGIRMGVWGAAQAIAFGLGGFAGTIAIDITRWLTGDVALSFAVVFTGEAVLFLISAMIATSIGVATVGRRQPSGHAPLAPAE
jgi:BCD family chlorophyll transporter-like MFS transporter